MIYITPSIHPRYSRVFSTFSHLQPNILKNCNFLTKQPLQTVPNFYVLVFTFAKAPSSLIREKKNSQYTLLELLKSFAFK